MITAVNVNDLELAASTFPACADFQTPFEIVVYGLQSPPSREARIRSLQTHLRRWQEARKIVVLDDQKKPIQAEDPAGTLGPATRAAIRTLRESENPPLNPARGGRMDHELQVFLNGFKG